MSVHKFSETNLARTVFVETPMLLEVAERATAYLNAGFPVHFSGPAGTGKTSLALYIAHKIGRPLILMHGNDDFHSPDLIGGNYGYRRKQVVDNYIHSVYSLQESLQYQWMDGRVTTACRNGYTLLYDEFTRSRPEVNNILLSVLEERMMSLPSFHKEGHYLNVHPEFRAIFTSNPEEYAGVHKTQIALADRMITIELDNFDQETEVAITVHKSGLPLEEALKIVNIVRTFRKTTKTLNPSIRCSIKMARVTAAQNLPISGTDPFFARICTDLLLSETPNSSKDKKRRAVEQIQNIIHDCCQHEEVDDEKP